MARTPNNEECSKCKYFRLRDYDNDNGGDGVGRCRRFPPILLSGLSDDDCEMLAGIEGSEVDFFDWPFVESGDWCGEYLQRP